MADKLLDSGFLNNTIQKYANGHDLVIHITDVEARILASTDSGLLGTKNSTAENILKAAHPAAIKLPKRGQGGNAVYGVPIYNKNELYGCVVLQGQADTASRQGEFIKISIESVLEYSDYSHSSDYSHTMETSEDRIALIAKMLLEDAPDIEKLLPLMTKEEINPNLTRTVICISLKFKNSYDANGKIIPGRHAGNKPVLAEAAGKLKKSHHLNSQDIVYLYDKNTIAIIKSFLPSSDPPAMYKAMETICEDFEKTLGEFNEFSFAISYGNLYQGIQFLGRSFNEAMEIILLGQQKMPENRRFVLEEVLFEKICKHIYFTIISKIMEPILFKLSKKDGRIPKKLISCAEAFVDSCMNFSETSKNHHIHRNTISTRLEKLKSLTGLDPVKSFQDAFVIKMLAAYIRQNYPSE